MNTPARAAARAAVVIFLICCAVRGFLLFSWLTPPALVQPDVTSEVGRVARSLTESGAFADPYAVPTGPTAHPPPVYTGLLALTYRALGVSVAAARLRAMQHIVSDATLLALLPWVASRLGLGLGAGIVGGLLGAVFPWRGLWDVIGWSGSEVHAAIALALLLVWCCHRWTAGTTPADSVAIGVAFGASFHLVPALALVLAGCLAFEGLHIGRHGRWRNVLLVVVGAAIACAPWAWRNHLALGGVPFVRSNFGLELRAGHHEGAAADMEAMGPWFAQHHPGLSVQEALEVRARGELEYMRRARREALDWIAAHPAETARLTAARLGLLFLGSPSRPAEAVPIGLLSVLAWLGLRRRWASLAAPQRAALLVPLATLPLVYCLVAYTPRYRVPIDWLFLMLAGAEVAHWILPGRLAAPART